MPAMSAPIHLRCEYFVNPIGIDARRPRFSWQLDDDRCGARQTAYQVVVRVAGASPALVSQGSEGEAPSPFVLWDSGTVDSDQSVHIEYQGQELKSRQQCEWKVRIWDHGGKPTDWSAPATFEMGLLERAD